jgi:multiple sugar transport system substrate-binding protein
MKMKKTMGTLLILLCMLLAFTSCGSPNSAVNPSGEKKQTAAVAKETPKPAELKKVSSEPVTIKIARPQWALTDQQFSDFVVAPLKKSHPNITIESLVLGINDKNLEQMLAKGDTPDIIITSNVIMNPLIAVGLAENMDPVLKSNKFDAGRLQPGALEAVKPANEGILSAIPYFQNFGVLYYNKDLFDKFGVAYPKDGMTWKQATELARKMTRSSDGVNYLGLHPGKLTRTAPQLGLYLVDPKTLKAAINTDGWRRNLEMHKAIWSIPGNAWIDEGKIYDVFSKDKTVAMLAAVNRADRFAQDPALNWDMATYPSFEGKPGVGMVYDLHVAAITSLSKHQDAAYQVISSLLSDEVQLMMARVGRLSVLKSDKMTKEFGVDLDYLKGKNLQAIFKVTPAPIVPTTKFSNIASSIVDSSLTKAVFTQGTDINTALRQAEEEINRKIEENK